MAYIFSIIILFYYTDDYDNYMQLWFGLNCTWCYFITSCVSLSAEMNTSAHLSRTSSAKTIRTHYTDDPHEDASGVGGHTDAFLTEVETEDDGDEGHHIVNFLAGKSKLFCESIYCGINILWVLYFFIFVSDISAFRRLEYAFNSFNAALLPLTNLSGAISFLLKKYLVTFYSFTIQRHT